MSDKLKKKIFEKIKKEDLKPISKSYFSWKNRGFWLLLIITIIIISASFSFFIIDLEDLKEILTYSSTGNSIFFLPNIFWLIVIIILVFIGIKEFRKTKYGYKTSLAILVVSIIIISGFAGLVFANNSYSRYIHQTLAQNIPFLSKYIYNEGAWNYPENGRLIGTIKEINAENIILTAIDGKEWIIDIKNISLGKNMTLEIGEKVRIFGNLNGENTFVATKFIPYFGEGSGSGLGRENAMGNGSGSAKNGKGKRLNGN